MNGENENIKVIAQDCLECGNWVKETDKESAHCADGFDYEQCKGRHIFSNTDSSKKTRADKKTGKN